MAILVTGGAGYIGSHMAHALVERGEEVVVLDNLATHKAKVVTKYVASTAGKLELHYLPGYAPELNPDELVWNYMKRTGTARRPLAKGEKLQDCIEADMLTIQRNPSLVRSFFLAPYVAYITD